MSEPQPEGTGLDHFALGRMLEFSGDPNAAKEQYLLELASLPDVEMTGYEKVRRARAVMRLGGIMIDHVIADTDISEQLMLAESKLTDAHTDLKSVAASQSLSQLALEPTTADLVAMRAHLETAKTVVASKPEEQSNAAHRGRQLYRLADLQLKHAERILRSAQPVVPSRSHVIEQPGDVSVEQFITRIQTESNRYVMSQDGDKRELWRVQNWMNAAEHEIRCGTSTEAWKIIGRAAILAVKSYCRQPEYAKFAVEHISRRAAEIGMPGMRFFRKVLPV